MISSFRDSYRFLSNFELCPVQYDELWFPSTEHAYQAAKAKSHSLRMYFTNESLTPGGAKRAGQKLDLREDWEQIKLGVMEDLLRQKFSSGSDLARKLLLTGDEELVEGNTWGDTYWGVDSVKGGQNNLGKLLMKIREELRTR